jgi:hypothetical protein
VDHIIIIQTVLSLVTIVGDTSAVTLDGDDDEEEEESGSSLDSTCSASSVLQTFA